MSCQTRGIGEWTKETRLNTGALPHAGCSGDHSAGRWLRKPTLAEPCWVVERAAGHAVCNQGPGCSTYSAQSTSSAATTSPKASRY